ncbi:GNAT family N-acetyltransferase [Actinomadura madurae]|uniref:GNAT family N-acetyltransferase n=1 Tax=Actinomadura madurae TaxID=1993 RepID=UPI0020265D98|nr:GNAT family N-acetyltransferase [Actinomadura madurae]MCP9950622.1 GNAT family N-acetyltransferase [Actinomadura madurae]MCP9967399.1 GNAT family N-acetyltransferase [Actinomadura madurae]MCP9979856.1 GNAT family N-acetyltransferase [Actinomadura madurae]URM96158.1 GNAT family N-acetyltransferase [Actinomadura madurae]URN06862.1 GNAT family N-acetyltransferase [Actinomadura madurae]
MIRTAARPDRPRIEEIVEAAYAPWAEVIGTRPLPMDADYGALIDAGRVFVTGDGPDGLIVLIPEDGALLVENVAVAPAHHGRGIGGTLLSFAEERARTLSLPSLRLYTNELMTKNIALYERIGYRETGREDIGGRYIVHMVKHLG